MYVALGLVLSGDIKRTSRALGPRAAVDLEHHVVR
jgi:hypothetical protein